MSRFSHNGFLPQSGNFPEAFRQLDFFRDFFFLEALGAYPINLWSPYLPDLFDSLSEKRRDFLFAFYSDGVPNLSASEVRANRQQLLAEIRDSYHFIKITNLIREYEDQFFCSFGSLGVCGSCGRSKEESLVSPLCSSVIMQLSLGKKSQDTQMPNQIDLSIWNSKETSPPLAEEFEIPTLDESDCAEPVELSEIQVDLILKYFGMTKCRKPIGKLQSDAIFHGQFVVVWRPQTQIDETDLDFFAEAFGGETFILLIDERFVPKIGIVLNIAVMVYSEKTVFDGVLVNSAAPSEILVPQ